MLGQCHQSAVIQKLAESKNHLEWQKSVDCTTPVMSQCTRLKLQEWHTADWVASHTATYSSQGVRVGVISEQQFDNEHVTLLSSLMQRRVSQLAVHIQTLYIPLYCILDQLSSLYTDKFCETMISATNNIGHSFHHIGHTQCRYCPQIKANS